MPKQNQGNRRTEHRFSQVPKATIPRSQFNRSHTHKTTFDAGLLIPIYVDEVLPGDTFNLNMTLFARLATPIFPIMDNMSLDVFFFFVPYRLVWDNWAKFCGEQRDPDDSIAFTIPQMTEATGAGVLAVPDHMGIPPGKTNTSVNALPMRSYNLIFQEWFRDENLQDAITVNRGDGPETMTNYRTLRSRGKRHDYFTSCLPWPQKQTLGVSLPIGETAPVVRKTATTPIGLEIQDGVPSAQQGVSHMLSNVSPTEIPMSMAFPGATGTAPEQNVFWGTDTGLETDLSSATAATINSLRTAFQIQKLLERDARGGTRLTELIRSHFGVSSPDSRLQRSEYLSGGSVPLMVSAVARTEGATTVGDLSAFATAAQSGIGFNKSFTEHGTIIGLVSARADLTYQQGLHRMWSRLTRYDFYWPAFAGLGEQSVLNQEIFFQNDDAGGAPPNDDNHKVFGFQERWAEYRYHPSRISGLFRSDHAQTIDPWHLSQKFTTLPILGDTFIKDTPPVDRVIAVPSEPHFIFDSYFDIKCARPLPVYSVPGLIDHF